MKQEVSVAVQQQLFNKRQRLEKPFLWTPEKVILNE